MNQVPIFLHIPKNAGTYVLGYTMEMFRCYGILSGWRNKKNWNIDLRRIILQNNEGVQISTIFLYDPEKIRDSNKYFLKYPQDEYCNIVSLNNFLEEISKKNDKLQIFSILIEDHGIKYIKDHLYDDICNINNISPLYYTILRNPYERALSLYSYLGSSYSHHEPTHGTIKTSTFEEYINSNQLEDSWLIRRLLNLPDNSIISSKNYEDACVLLDKFKIKNINEVESLLNEVFFLSYQITKEKIKDLFIDSINKNRYNYKIKIPFESLNEQTKKNFSLRTRFDADIYNKYCKF
jgi:hypothetical protein